MKIKVLLYDPTPNEYWTSVQWEVNGYSTLKKVQKHAEKIIKEICCFHSVDFPIGIGKIDLYDDGGKRFIASKFFASNLLYSSPPSSPNCGGESSDTGEFEKLTPAQKRTKLEATIVGDVCTVYIGSDSNDFSQDFDIRTFGNGDRFTPDVIAYSFAIKLSIFLSEQKLEATNGAEIYDYVFQHLCETEHMSLSKYQAYQATK